MMVTALFVPSRTSLSPITSLAQVNYFVKPRGKFGLGNRIGQRAAAKLR